MQNRKRLWVENVKSNHPPQSKPFMHVFHIAAYPSSDNQSFSTIKTIRSGKANQRKVIPKLEELEWIAR
ncbi:hypothetical protein FOXG_19817 [Fusarium oxysporum f. sp. lycopersici 4287]|uniref:Uncharacterized protein n=2 Tax=Fusarium oxysporum TaxID=5507 RepID=A0A0J9V8M3_FUSO4|nr:hypothetical protein FOXG_19817 [Fusarium oxysporum f. sp. lycopersici 4287]EXK32122.1 hypothetical protein FOMG_12428 [Fusarium oxysporum f. sp. melonis 26406]KNB07251.1 hypothetical protein FOXG_19817 [Fusarium oxysporum f. sp. lycopersici 4287]